MPIFYDNHGRRVTAAAFRQSVRQALIQQLADSSEQQLNAALAHLRCESHTDSPPPTVTANVKLADGEISFDIAACCEKQLAEAQETVAREVGASASVAPPVDTEPDSDA